MRNAFFTTGTIFIILGAALPDLLGISYSLTAGVLVLLFFITMFIFEHIDSKNAEGKLIDSIIAKLSKDGYECKKEEGSLTFYLQGRRYWAYIWKTGRNQFRVEFVDYANIDEDWDNISFDGKSVLANYVNNECPYTSIVSSHKGVVCSHVTTVDDADDFLVKAKQSYNLFHESFDKVADIMPQIKERYTIVEKKHIGFNNYK